MTDLTSRVAQERERLQAVERLVSLAEIERKTILSTLELCRGSREETAQRLGISVSTLYRRLAEYRRDAMEPLQPIVDHECSAKRASDECLSSPGETTTGEVQGQMRRCSKNKDGGVSH
jgi:AraC-like DNA-binding protein